MTKKRLAVSALAILTVWPAAHYGLYRRYSIDPWKLGGWAMYTRPRTVRQLGIFELRGEAAVPLEVRDSQAVADEIARLGRRRGVFGELQGMDSLGQLLLAEQPELEGVRLIVRRVGFDCMTATLDDIVERSYDYRR